MKSKPWTPEELKLLTDGELSLREVAQKTGRTVAAVSHKRDRLGAPRKTVVAEPASYDQDKTRATDAHWKSRYDSLHTKYSQALKDAVLVDKLVEDVKSMAPMSYDPAPPVSTTRKASKSSPQSAVLLLSDTHVGKVVLPTQTLNFGGYNYEIFLARLKYVEESVISIMRDHVNTDVPELVIALLGDMLDGNLAHGVEAGLRNTLFQQFFGAGHALAQFLRNVAAHVPKIRIETVVGNHTRWADQKRMPTENRFSNLDMFLYAFVQALTNDIPNIHWRLNMQPFQIFDVQGFCFYASHGDHWKGGDKALGIPNHAIGRQVSATTQLFHKHGAAVPNYYISGHLHRSITLPHAMGEVIVNGGFPGLDNYALSGNFNPVDPIQRFFFCHPKYGRTATYDLSLKYADTSGEVTPYFLPPAFGLE